MNAKIYPAFLHVSLILLLAISVVLVRQNHALREQLTPRDSHIQVGQVVGPVEVANLDGEARVLAWDDAERDRLLLVFTTTCPACAQNQGVWQALHRQLGDRLEVIGVSLDDPDLTRVYREAHELEFDVVTAADREGFLADYEISSVPLTLRISPDGRVRGAWSGGLSDDQMSEVASGT